MPRLWGFLEKLKKKLNKTKPKNLLEASGVEGITPAALNVLAIHLKKLMQSEQAEMLKRLANLIAEKNKQHNLTSAKTPEEIYKTHINDCVQAFKKVQKTLRKTVIDCGSGAGCLALFGPH